MLEPVRLCLPAQLFSPVPTGLLGIGPGKGWAYLLLVLSEWLQPCRSQDKQELGGPGRKGHLRQMGNVPVPFVFETCLLPLGLAGPQGPFKSCDLGVKQCPAGVTIALFIRDFLPDTWPRL